MNEFCSRCEGRGEMYASGLCGGCDAYRMDGEENGFAVRLPNSSVVFRAVALLSPWNGFPVPLFASREAMRVVSEIVVIEDEDVPVIPHADGTIEFSGLAWELVDLNA